MGSIPITDSLYKDLKTPCCFITNLKNMLLKKFTFYFNRVFTSFWNRRNLLRTLMFEKLISYFLSFKEHFIVLFTDVKSFILRFHSVFTFIAICYCYYFTLLKFLYIVCLFEIRMNLMNLQFFKDKFEVLDKDEVIMRNHWQNDLDLLWLSRFLSSFRTICFFLLIISLTQPLFINIKPTFCWDLLIFSFIVEMLGDCHIIFFRNTKVNDTKISFGAAFLKGFGKVLSSVLGEEASTKFMGFTAVVAENPTVAGGAAAAGAAYEKSKHPIVAELGKKEILNDNSFLNQSKQYITDGVIHTDSHSDRMYTLYQKHLKKFVKISELTEDGVFCQRKVREKFLTCPEFASEFYKNPHCFQPFGLGDKMVPSEAIEANERNKILHGEQRAKELGLIIDYIPGEQYLRKVEQPQNVDIPKMTGIPTLKFQRPITFKDLPGFNPMDPSANLPKVTESKTWFKP